MYTTPKAKYPYDELDDEDMETSHCQTVSAYKSILDFPRHGQKKEMKSIISKPGAVTKGARPVRQYHYIDESKILPHKRAGITLEFDISYY